MLRNRAHRESGRASVESANGFLKGRMQRSLAAVSGMRNTSNLPQLARTLHQAAQGGATNPLCLCCITDGCSS